MTQMKTPHHKPAVHSTDFVQPAIAEAQLSQTSDLIQMCLHYLEWVDSNGSSIMVYLV